MSKRKRASKPDPDESTDDASAKDDMVHVSSDMLAGGPDVFTSKKADGDPAEEPVTEAAGEAAPEVVPEPVAAEAEPELAPPAEPPAPSAEMAAPEPAEAPAAEAATQPSPPPAVEAVPYSPPRARPSASSTAIGIVLVVIGIFALFVVMTGIDLTQSGWPLFIIIPGLTLLVVGFVWAGSVATVPGGIVTMLGLVLAYTSASDHWPMWAYAWTLVVPFGVGIGIYLQALRDRDQSSLRSGRTLMLVGAMMFLIGFVLFESILGVSGRDAFGPVGKAALPALLIIVGIILLVRSVQRGRAT